MESYPRDGRQGDDPEGRSTRVAGASGGVTIPPCPGIPHTAEQVAAADAAARADIAAGRVHSHDEVAAWLRTWGSPDYKPFHEWRR